MGNCDIESLDINITEQDGLYNLREIVSQLKILLINLNTHAMSDYALVLHGRREMLRDIILYLEKL